MLADRSRRSRLRSLRHPPSPTDTQGVKVLPPNQSGAQKAAPGPGEPTEQSLGLPIHPGAQFIGSYDAGRGQRYYLYGINTDFAPVVAYYRTTLKQRGELVLRCRRFTCSRRDASAKRPWPSCRA